MCGAVRSGNVELFCGRCNGGDSGAEQHTQLHSRQPDAAAGAEHDELLAFLNPGDRAQECDSLDATTSSANAPRSIAPLTRSASDMPRTSSAISNTTPAY